MEDVNIVPAKKLWNPKFFVLISILFSFFPAGVMYSLNYGRSGNKRKKWTSLASITILFLIICILLFTVPASLSFFKYIIYGLNIGTGIYLSNNQAALYEDHIRNGGEKASYILPVIICVIVSALLIAANIYSDFIPDNSLKYSKNQLYYTDNVTASEAKKLGDYLKTQGFFSDDSEVDVKIDKQNEIYIFSLIVTEDYQSNNEFADNMKQACNELSENVFNNKKVRIDFCNNKFQIQKSFTSG